MKLLFDENLSPRLVGALADVYPGSVHVHQSGLGSTDDAAIWKYGHPQKSSGCAQRTARTEIESLLRAAVPVVARFIQEDEESCLVLGVRAKTK